MIKNMTLVQSQKLSISKDNQKLLDQHKKSEMKNNFIMKAFKL